MNLFATNVGTAERKTKLFSIAVQRGPGLAGSAAKLGEIPQFGPHTPARVITLIGLDRELFLQGGGAENHGMGIGAFSYYRRVQALGNISGDFLLLEDSAGGRLIPHTEAAKRAIPNEMVPRDREQLNAILKDLEGQGFTIERKRRPPRRAAHVSGSAPMSRKNS